MFSQPLSRLPPILDVATGHPAGDLYPATIGLPGRSATARIRPACSVPQSRALKRQLRALLHVLQDPELHFFWILMTLTLIAGTAFYSLVEGWSVLDALFFSVITLTTVGYGNLSPSTPGSKIFTIVYILVGIGIFLTLVNKLASGALRRSRELRDERDQSEKAP